MYASPAPTMTNPWLFLPQTQPHLVPYLSFILKTIQNKLKKVLQNDFILS